VEKEKEMAQDKVAPLLKAARVVYLHIGKWRN